MLLICGLKFLAIISQHMDNQQPTTAEKVVSKTKEEIIKEAKRIEEALLYSSKGHFSFWGSALQVFGQCGGASMRTKFWQNYFLGRKGFAKTSADLFLNSDVANGKGFGEEFSICSSFFFWRNSGNNYFLSTI